METNLLAPDKSELCYLTVLDIIALQKKQRLKVTLSSRETNFRINKSVPASLYPTILSPFPPVSCLKLQLW